LFQCFRPALASTASSSSQISVIENTTANSKTQNDMDSATEHSYEGNESPSRFQHNLGVANGHMSGVMNNMEHTHSDHETTNRISRNNHLHAYGSMRKTASSSAMARASGTSRRSSFGSDIENMSVSDVELHSELSEISSKVCSHVVSICIYLFNR
jgi:hypothetical protein